jgi:hypothetical protein
LSLIRRDGLPLLLVSLLLLLSATMPVLILFLLVIGSVHI